MQESPAPRADGAPEYIARLRLARSRAAQLWGGGEVKASPVSMLARMLDVRFNGREEIRKVNRRDVGWRSYMEQGQPMMARLTETSDRITHESEAMQNWFEEQRRVPGSYFCIIMGGIHQRPGTLVLTDDLLREWRASWGYQTFCKENKWPFCGVCQKTCTGDSMRI